MALRYREERLRAQNQRQRWIFAFTISAATLALGFYTVTAFHDSRALRERDYEARDQIAVVMREAKNAEEAAKDARMQLDETLQRLSHIKVSSNQPAEVEQRLAAITQDLSNVKQQVDTLQHGIDGINAAITSTPEKAVAVPLLKKDVDDFKSSTQHDIDTVRAEMIRSYDQTKWLLGFILAALIGTVINSAIQSRGANRHFTAHKQKFE